MWLRDLTPLQKLVILLPYCFCHCCYVLAAVLTTYLVAGVCVEAQSVRANSFWAAACHLSLTRTKAQVVVTFEYQTNFRKVDA